MEAIGIGIQQIMETVDFNFNMVIRNFSNNHILHKGYNFFVLIYGGI